MKFIQGLELCESFFREAAQPVLRKEFPDLNYSAGLLGYGSDVLGYDDQVSSDHMWGPPSGADSGRDGIPAYFCLLFSGFCEGISGDRESGACDRVGLAGLFRTPAAGL